MIERLSQREFTDSLFLIRNLRLLVCDHIDIKQLPGNAYGQRCEL